MRAAPVLAFAAASLPGLAAAHHGWAWTTGKNLELVGTIVEARLGNPHGVLIVDSDGARWIVEVGQPWRNAQAGLKPATLARGIKARFVGEPSANPKERRLKVERLFLGDREYVLYPQRD